MAQDRKHPNKVIWQVTIDDRVQRSKTVEKDLMSF